MSADMIYVYILAADSVGLVVLLLAHCRVPFALFPPDSVAFGGHGWKPKHRARAGRQGRRRRRAGRGRNDSRWVGGWVQALTCHRAGAAATYDTFFLWFPSFTFFP